MDDSLKRKLYTGAGIIVLIIGGIWQIYGRRAFADYKASNMTNEDLCNYRYRIGNSRTDKFKAVDRELDARGEDCGYKKRRS